MAPPTAAPMAATAQEGVWVFWVLGFGFWVLGLGFRV